MSDKPVIESIGLVRVSPALLRQAARILHREAKQLRESYTVPTSGEWQDQLAHHDYTRYRQIASELEQAARGPLL